MSEPQLWSLQQSYTMPLLANGHTKPGLLPPSLYTGHGTLPRARLDHLANTCSRYELRQAAEMDVDCAKSYDQLLGGAGGTVETDTQMMIESTSGSAVQQSEVSVEARKTVTTDLIPQAEDVSETDVLVPTFSPSVTMDKY